MIYKYIDHLHQINASPHTIKGYAKDLAQFANFMALLSEDKRSIAFWSKSLTGKPATINRKIAAVKSYYAFCKKFGYLDIDPSKDLAFRKKSTRLPKFNTTDRLALLSESQIQSLTKEQFAALTLLSETGIRLAELCTIKRSDLTQNSIKVTGKGDKQRIVPISKHLSALLFGLDRNLDKNSDNTFLFNLKPHQVQYLTRKYLGCNPHTLRHTFATTLINAGAPLLSIKELLGHSSINATQIYTHLDFERLKAVHQACHKHAYEK